MQLSAGSRLGPYEIVSPIGAGGMGQVWRATDTRLRRDVAIKVLPSEFADNAQLRLRFQREAEAISHLNHPHICTLYDVGDGYLVMEFLEGETLASRLKKGPLPIGEVLRHGGEIAEALERAHKSNVVHRDLKPANVMLTKSGAKLLDFGIAKPAIPIRDASPEEATFEQGLVTTGGVVLGTLQYMAPEQLAGEPLDARADIFALGATLYEMATGKRAFEGANSTSIISAIVSGQPRSMSELQPLTPPLFEHVVMKCLEKERDDRWQDAHDVADQLAFIRSTLSGPAAAHARSPRRSVTSFVIAAAALAIVVTAGVLGYGMYRLRTQRHADYSFEIPVTTAEYRNALVASISPDGTKVAFTAVNPSGQQVLFVRQLDSLNAEAIPATSGIFASNVATEGPVWSSDGRFLFFWKQPGFCRVAASGGPIEEIAANAPDPLGATCNRDGVILFAGGRGAISRVERVRSSRFVTKLNPASGQLGHVRPSFLPDGKHFLFTSLQSHGEHRLWVASIQNSEAKLIGEFPSGARYSNGYLLFVRNHSLMAIPFDVKKLSISGEEVPVMAGVAGFHPIATGAFSVSEDGTLVCRDWDNTGPLKLFTSDGKLSREFPASYINIFSVPRVTPDGHSFAVAAMDTDRGTSDLWLWGIDKNTQTRITFDIYADYHPILSPDMKKLYFSSARDDWADIYEKTIGSSGDRLLLSLPVQQFVSDLSPDGRWLLFDSTHDPKNAVDIFAIDVTQSTPKPLAIVSSPAMEMTGRFSRDGRWIIYCSNETGTYQLYSKSFPGLGAPRQLTTEGVRWRRQQAFRISRDGRRIFFIRGLSIFSLDFNSSDGSASNEHKVMDLPSEPVAFEVAPDGGFLLQFNDGPVAPNRVYTNWTRLLKK